MTRCAISRCSNGRLAAALGLVAVLLGPGVRSTFAQDNVFVPDEVLVQFRADATEADKVEARSFVNAQRRRLIRGNGAPELEQVSLPPGIPVQVAVEVLSRHPAVSFAEPNWIYTREESSDDFFYTAGFLWGLYGDDTVPANQFGSAAGEAWEAGHVGSRSVVVAVIDQGIDHTHSELVNNIWTNPEETPGNGIDDDGNGYIDDVHGYDFYSNDSSVYDGQDLDYHGTHVAGTIGAEGGDGGFLVGVNWKVTLISAKFLGPNGGSTADVIRALDYLIDLKTRYGLDLVATNNSYGGGGYSQAFHDAIIRAAKAGILFVAAAGNGNMAGIGQNNDKKAHYPSNYDTSVGTSTEPAAAYDSVIAVAAIDSVGAKPTFSNYGATTVDLGAPGVNIYSTTPDETVAGFSGTSMATPHVTGAAALYRSMHPGSTAEEVKNAIIASAMNTPTPSLAGQTATNGRLNIGWFVGESTNNPPVADSGGPYGAMENDALAFDGSSSSDPDGDTLTYSWDFGDGTTGTGMTPSHAYLWGGNFTVTLTVGDGNMSDTSTTSAAVTEVNDPPTANAGGPYSGPVGQPVTFDASGSFDPDNGDGTPSNNQNLTYTWDFGDGTVESTANALTTHAYASDGTYVASLTVNDTVVNSPPAVAAVTITAAAPGGTNDIYVWSIEFDSRTRGKGGSMHDERIVVTVRRDSDGDRTAEASDEVVSGVPVTVNLAGVGSSSGTTSASGQFVTKWFTNLPDGTYTADVTLAPAVPLTWNQSLDQMEDAQHTIPH